jgi:elongation factor Ts
MTNVEKVKQIREQTFSPINKINAALAKTNGDVDAAIKILIAEKQVDANDMANRVAASAIVHSYVHNNRVGAMVVLACQTDFSAKNDLFLNLAKDVCMHIVSTPVAPIYVDESNIPEEIKKTWQDAFAKECTNKPPQIVEKIVAGKMKKWYGEMCLLNQPFIKDDTKTVKQLIQDLSSTIGEKIEVKRFVKVVAQ